MNQPPDPDRFGHASSLPPLPAALIETNRLPSLACSAPLWVTYSITLARWPPVWVSPLSFARLSCLFLQLLPLWSQQRSCLKCPSPALYPYMSDLTSGMGSPSIPDAIMDLDWVLGSCFVLSSTIPPSGPALLALTASFTATWYHMKDAILEGGIPYDKSYGMSIFEHYASDCKLSKLFNNAMVDMSTMVMKKILANYKGFEGVSTLVDMGGNKGASLSMIISKYPNIRGINFDLSHVVGDGSEYPGVTHIGGDMFVRLPKADAIFIKSIFHNWDDEHCIKFMKNCYAALPNRGKVIACEIFIPTIPETNVIARMAYHYDLLMMVACNARERTKLEFEAIGKAAGFEGFRVVCSAYEFKVMEFLKKN